MCSTSRADWKWELTGTEHFSPTIFMTTKAELTAEGWAKHEAHGNLAAPLTEEEKNLEGIREAEAQESTGTATRRGGHIKGGISLPISADALHALKRLKVGEEGVVQLVGANPCREYQIPFFLSKYSLDFHTPTNKTPANRHPHRNNHTRFQPPSVRPSHPLHPNLHRSSTLHLLLLPITYINSLHLHLPLHSQHKRAHGLRLQPAKHNRRRRKGSRH